MSKGVRVLVFDDRAPAHIQRLKARFPDIRFHGCTSYAALATALATHRPTVVFATPFEPLPYPREALLACPSLRWIANGFAGVDHLAPWDESRITVTNVAGVAAEEMAQYVLAAILGLHQLFPLFARRQAARHWEQTLVRSAVGARVGIVGLGRTGRAVARLSRAVGMSVVACRSTAEPSPLVDHIYAQGELHVMLAEVDATVMCAALTPQTRDMFDRKAFAAMRRGSYFVNVARGGAVVEADLIEALVSGQLGGAVIDVTRHEPLPPDDPLWTAPNLLITPHTSSEYVGWHARAADMFADNLQRWLAGEPLENVVSARRGY